MSIRYIQPAPNPWEGVATLIGGLLGNNQRQKREQASTEAMIGLMNPSSVDQSTGAKSELQIDPSLTKMTPYKPTPQFQMPIQQQPSLLSGAPADMSYEGLVKQPNVTGNNALAMPKMQAPQTPQATVSTRQRGIKDVEKEIRADYYGRLSQAVKEKKLTSADVKELMPAMRQQMAADIASAKESYTQKQQDEAYSAFETEQDPRKKIMIGMKAGLIGKEGAMMLIQPGTETKVINTGSENVVVGFNKLTGKYVNLKDNSEIPAEQLQAMLKPTAKPKAASEYEQWKMNNGVGIPRGSSGSGDKNDATMYKWASTYTLQPTGEVDYMGKPIMTRVQNNPELARQLGAKLGYTNQGQGDSPQPQGQAGDPKSAFIQGAMNQFGLTAEQAEAEWAKRQGGQPQARPQITMNDTSTIDEISNNWQY